MFFSNFFPCLQARVGFSLPSCTQIYIAVDHAAALSQCLLFETGDLHVCGVVTKSNNAGKHITENSAKIGTGMD